MNGVNRFRADFRTADHGAETQLAGATQIVAGQPVARYFGQRPWL
jgi:hypothetical protein